MAGRKRQTRKHFHGPQQTEDLEKLLVFGYECKLFRDDEKALHIDQGRHLIPWMGDSSLLIDRYDGRGHLYDLHEYDTARTAGKMPEMTEEEKRIEDLCDEERYLELHTDIAEKAMYEEEELKRLNDAFDDCYYDYGGYAAVGFNYNADMEQQEYEMNQDDKEMEDEDEELFEVPVELMLPEGIIPPLTVKMAKIIEKTAKFVSMQGAQMEIRIKMKQHDNPLFAFLDFHDEVNPFYKHVVTMIKAGKYKPKLEEPPETKRQDSEAEGCHGDDDLSGQPEGQEYLHPSLINARQAEPEINSKEFLESVQAKLPSGQMSNTLYEKLVSKLTANSGRSSPVTLFRPAVAKSEAGTSSVAGYREEVPRPPPPPPILGATIHSYMAQPGDGGSVYGPPLANLPPPPGMEPVTLPTSGQATTQPPPPGTVPPEPVSSALQTMSSRDKHGHVQEEQEEIHDGDHTIVPPPPDVQPIIDKMASYVAKNGPDFEMIVKAKTDERFQFLHHGHVHNLYYEYKKHLYEKEFATEKVKVTITQTSQNALGDTVVTKTTTTLANVQPSKGVSFSIKAKESEGPTLSGRKMALLYDSSDDEDGGQREQQEGDVNGSEGRSSGTGSHELQGSEKPIRPEKPQLSLEDLERRQAEERQKDRISNAAREKVAQASREKQLQAERKRRAAMFINMLKGSGPATAPPPGSATIGSQGGGAGTVPVFTNIKDEVKDVSSTGAASSSTSMSPRISPHTSRTQSPASLPLIRSRGNSSTRSPPRSKSPVRSKKDHRDKDRGYNIDIDRQRVRDRDRNRDRDKRDRQRDKDHFRRSPVRSRSPVWSRRRSRSPRRRNRSKTPPSAYSIVRRSRSKSPLKKRSATRSRSPMKHKKKSTKKSRSRSPSREKLRKLPALARKRSRSRSKTRRSRSRSKTHKSRASSVTQKARSRSKSKEKKSKKRSKNSPRKSKSRSRSRSRKPKSRSVSRSRKTKSRSKSPTKSKKSKRKSRSSSPVKTSLKHSTEAKESDKLPQIVEVTESNNIANFDVIIQDKNGDEPIEIPAPSPPPELSGNGVEENLEASATGQQSESGSTYSATTPPSGGLTPPSTTSSGKAPVSQALLSKVRAMLKASRAQILQEEGV